MKRRKEGESRVLTYKQAAEYMGVGKTTVHLAVGRGELPAVKIGKSVRFLPEDLDDYLQRQRSVKSGGRWKKGERNNVANRDVA